MKNNQDEVYTLEHVVFIFLVHKKKDRRYEKIEFNEVMENKSKDNMKISLYDSFRTDYKNVKKGLDDILRIFRIKDAFQQCKKQKGGYQFDKQDAEFLAELLYRYYNEKIWKEDIRKVKNEEFNGFIKIYKDKNGRQLLGELKFVIDGFLNIFQKAVGKDTEKYIVFENTLYACTRYRRLEWIQEIEVFLFDSLPLNEEELFSSKNGELLVLEQKKLEELGDFVKNIIDAENESWEDLKERCINRFMKKTYSLEIQFLIYALIEKMKEIDLEIGESFEDVYNNKPDRHSKWEGLEAERRRNEKVKMVFKQAFEKLGKEAQADILRAVLEDEDGNVDDIYIM